MKKLAIAGACVLLLAACSSDDDSSGGAATTPAAAATEPAATDAPVATDAPAPEPTLRVGAASRSVLPTVDQGRDYLAEAPGWDDIDPTDPGVFVPAWDQGRVDVGNGNEDGSWVHDDLRSTAVAFDDGEQVIVMVSSDVYMVFKADADEIERRAMALLEESNPELAARTKIIVAATHDHHGPDTAFSVNDEWYATMADATAEAIDEAVASLQPATLSVATGDHHFGVADARDPLIVDTRLNVMTATADDGSTIATLVQWGSHPETTLGYAPPIDLTEACAVKGWEGDDCSAEGRYFTADYPGVLRTRLQAEYGGEVAYFNGAIGSQIGPGRADVWAVDGDHPVSADSVAPAGAQPVAGAADLRDRNFARTEAIGTQLATAVEGLVAEAQPVGDSTLGWSEQSFFSRLTNIGFRVLLADGDLGWQDPVGYVCSGRPFTDETCTPDGGENVDDPILTPLIESQIRKGDVVQSRLVFVTVGDVGFMFMPGELPPELVIGLPDDFATNTAGYYENPDLHATGADYAIPGALLDLVPTDTTFTVGLGGDELGYWVPLNEVRLKCLDVALPAELGYTCQRLFDEGVLVTPDAVAGPVCHDLAEGTSSYTGDQALALTAVCRYGQALGRELGEPEDHYEETNSAGWDLVDDLWAAALALFGTG